MSSVLGWMAIYRDFTCEELRCEIQTLRKQAGGYVSQSVGSKSFSKDLRASMKQLQAAQREYNRRCGGSVGEPGQRGVVDHRGVDPENL